MDIQELIETFSRHEIEAKKNKEELLMRFMEDYPNEIPPDHMTNDFCITTALKLMCQEIADIKFKIGMK